MSSFFRGLIARFSVRILYVDKSHYGDPAKGRHAIKRREKNVSNYPKAAITRQEPTIIINLLIIQFEATADGVLFLKHLRCYVKNEIIKETSEGRGEWLVTLSTGGARSRRIRTSSDKQKSRNGFVLLRRKP